MKASSKVGIVLIVCYLVAWLDRMAINMGIPFIAKELNIGPAEIGWIMSAFFAGYALCQIPGGILADKFGPRKVILGGLGWWSIFTALTGCMASLPAMLVTRFAFGLGEGIFPAGVWKVLGQWFTKKNRATANALILTSIALGPALTPMILAPILSSYGWRAAFYILGVLGIICVLLCYKFVTNSIYEYKGISQQEIEMFEADAQSAAANAEVTLEKVSFWDLCKTPIVWILFFSVLIYNICLYGWLNWLPSYLMKVKGLDLKTMAMAASLPFAFAAVGTALAGYVSDKWLRGRRKRLVVGCQIIGGICLYFFTQISDIGTYMVLQCAAGFLLFMGFSAIWTLPMVLLPTKLMGSGSGLINMGGQLGGFLTNILIGYFITMRGGNYAAGFEVMLGALAIATVLVLVGIRERVKVTG